MRRRGISEMRRCQAVGLVGTLLLALGGLGAGALPLHADSGSGLFRGYPGVGLMFAYCGLVMLVLAWWRLGSVVRNLGPLRPRAMVATLGVWAAPLILVPPLFSRDAYSYLAQGAMVIAHIDVYRHGPDQLGGPLAAEVPALWQHTAAPYGPVFLLLAAAVVRVTGSDVIFGVLGLRLLAVAGVGLMAVFVPRLAARHGIDPADALWLGVLNPLVLLHLLSGAHNDAVMIGVMMAGLALAAAGQHSVGAALVTVAALTKAPAALALLVVVRATQVRATQGRASQVRATQVRAVLATGAVAAATTVAVTAMAGTGYGWLSALDTPISATNWSLTRVAGRATELVLGYLDGDVATLAIPVWRWLGLVAAAVVAVVAWHRQRVLGPVFALGLALAALALLGPAFRPWYLLWGVVPIAAGALDRRSRLWAAGASMALAMVVLPDGFGPTLVRLGQALLGGALGLALGEILGLGLALGLPRAARGLPRVWRGRPQW